MHIESIELREIAMRLKFPFETSFGVEQERRNLLVTVKSEGLEGIAECVAGEFPGYSYETTDTAWSVLSEFVIPKVQGKSYETPESLLADLQFIRGHNMAVAAVEMAFWDLKARRLEVPLWSLLGGVRTDIPVGISLGIQDSVAATAEQAQNYVDEGYKRIKLKIKPGWDIELVAGVREALPDTHLTVDANSAYRLADARIFHELDAFKLDYIEQPLAYDDLHDHAELQRQIVTPICLDESIHSPDDARKGLQHGAGRIINVKVGRVRGYCAAKATHDVAKAFGAPVWCGGMLETGIGRAHNLHLSTLENFLLPGDTSSSSRYWEEDIVAPLLEAENGIQKVPKGSGLGVTLKHDFLEQVTARCEMWQ